MNQPQYDQNQGGGYYPSSSNATSFFQHGLEPTAMKYRLDTDNLLTTVEMSLSSTKLGGKEVNGEWVEEMVRVGRPLMNQSGVQAIMGYLRMTVGPHNVQGNLDWDRYDALIYEINVYLAENVMANLINWDVREEDYNMIIDSIMTTIQLFLSRTVNNGERLSYGQSMMTKEMNVVGGPEKKGFMSRLFGGG